MPLSTLAAEPTSATWYNSAIEKALRAKGITSLYSHQAEALRAPRHVVVATPTSSGKSLAYTLPAIKAVCDDPYARALLLFCLTSLIFLMLKERLT